MVIITRTYTDRKATDNFVHARSNDNLTGLDLLKFQQRTTATVPLTPSFPKVLGFANRGVVQERNPLRIHAVVLPPITSYSIEHRRRTVPHAPVLHSQVTISACHNPLLPRPPPDALSLISFITELCWTGSPASLCQPTPASTPTFN